MRRRRILQAFVVVLALVDIAGWVLLRQAWNDRQVALATGDRLNAPSSSTRAGSGDRHVDRGTR